MSSRRLVALALLPAAAGCLREYTVSEFDELVRTSEVRTILLEDEFSLYSPFDPGITRLYGELVRRQRAEVFALFAIERAEPTVFELLPTPGISVDVEASGNGIRVVGAANEPHHGVRGAAPLGQHVVIAVDERKKIRLADGREIEGGWEPSVFESTIRHELVHVALRLCVREPDGWLHEGMAHAVQWLPSEGGALRPEPESPYLQSAAALPHDARAFERLLDWQQSFPPTDEDRAARLLAFSLVTFELERGGSPSLRDVLERLAALRRVELLALQPEWSAWLDRIAASPPPVDSAP